MLMFRIAGTIISNELRILERGNFSNSVSPSRTFFNEGSTFGLDNIHRSSSVLKLVQNCHEER